jgi:hypothetical protein
MASSVKNCRYFQSHLHSGYGLQLKPHCIRRQINQSLTLHQARFQSLQATSSTSANMPAHFYFKQTTRTWININSRQNGAPELDRELLVVESNTLFLSVNVEHSTPTAADIMSTHCNLLLMFRVCASNVWSLSHNGTRRLNTWLGAE